MDPFRTHKLSVSSIHTLHIEEYGNPDGHPIVYLHGGPGAGCSYNEHKLFDHNHFRIILFDQRGAGKSTPYASIEEQSTQELVDDLERVREYIGVDKWSVVGGSWGSALALYYTNAHAHRVERLLLRGLFLADRKGALNISEDGGANQLRPDYWSQYADWEHIGNAGKSRLIQSYNDALNCGDKNIELEAAERFMKWDNSIATAEYQEDIIRDASDNPMEQLAISRLWFHFAHNEFSRRPNPDILNMHEALDCLPIEVVQGTHDYICPVENARLFGNTYPHARINIIEGAGHSMLDSKIAQAIKASTDRWIEQLQTSPKPGYFF
jgi:proline iminopeptidase